jgi:hypothetical protein
MNASRNERNSKPESIGPDYSRWDELRESKVSIVGRVLGLLQSLAAVNVGLVLTDVVLCCIAGLILHFCPNPYGILGAIAIGVMVIIVGFLLGRAARGQNAQNTKETADPSTKPGNERGSSKKPRTTSRPNRR